MHHSSTFVHVLARPLSAAALACAALSGSAGAQVVDIACSFCDYDEVRHLWRIPGHSVFSSPVELQKRCAYLEAPQTEYFVAADGTQSSVFEVQQVVTGTCQTTLMDPQPVFVDGNWQPVSQADPDVYGSFEIEEREEDFVRFKYTHPVEPPPAGVKFREVRIGIIYWNPDFAAPQVNNVLLLHVTRPPVVMTHGLWSNRGSFAAMEEELANGSYPRELLYRVDYEASNDARFVDNRRVAELGVYSVLKQAAGKDFAAGKVDLVGHSMGGILSRLYVQGEYFQPNRDVRRIVTCNSPHSGSQMANWLLDGSPQAAVLCKAAELGLGSCYNGAVNDLSVFSPGIKSLLNRTSGYPGDVDVHALITVDDIAAHIPTLPAEGFARASGDSLLLAIFGSCASDDFFATVFNGDDNDLVVAAASQAGGLQGTATSTYPGMMHIGSTAQAAVIAQVKSLLNDPEGSDRFTSSYYNPPALQYFAPPLCLPAPAPLHGFSLATVSITAPSAGTAWTAGQPVVVAVDGSPEIAHVLLLLSHRGGEVFLAGKTGSDPQFNPAVPQELAGTRTLVAIGFDAGGRAVATSAPVEVTITVGATLKSLSVYPPSLFLAQGQTGSLEIKGEYDDGITRDLGTVATLSFAFAEGNASKSGTDGVTLNAAADDTLTVTYQGVNSAPVTIAAFPLPEAAAAATPIRRRLRRE